MPILGVAVATAAVELARVVLWQPIPVPESDRLVVFEAHNLSSPVFRDLETALGDRLSRAAFSNLEVAVSDGGGHRRLVHAAVVTDRYFDVLQIAGLHGRRLTALDQPPSVAISERLTRTLFAGADATSRTLTVGAGTFPVAGVVPDWFHGLNLEYPVDLWMPVSVLRQQDARAAKWSESPNVLWLTGIARPREPASRDRVAGWFTAAGASIRHGYEAWRPQFQTSIEPLSVAAFAPEIRAGVRRGAMVVAVTAVFLLLMAALNTATLEFTALQTRRAEYGIRSACGATSGQLFAEAARRVLAMAVVCYGAGLWLAGLFAGMLGDIRVATATRLPADVTSWTHLARTGLWITSGLIAIVAIVTYLGVRRPDVAGLARSGRGLAGGRISRVGLRVVVVLQSGCTFALLAVALTLVLAYRNQSGLDVGFNKEGLLFVPVDYRASGAQGRSADLRAAVTQRALAAPGVRGVSWSQTIPLGGVRFVDSVRGGTDRWHDVTSNYVAPDYFAVMGIPALNGSPELLRKGSVVVSEGLARRIWGTTDVTGRAVLVNAGKSLMVCGVVKDTYTSGPDQPAEAFLYLPLSTEPAGSEYLVLRYDSEGALPSPAGVADLTPGLVTGETVSMKELLSRVTARTRLLAWTASLFGWVALVLGGAGVFALATFVVHTRKREFGIRLAVGASILQVSRHAVSEAWTLIGCGLFLGYLATRPLLLAVFPEFRALMPAALPLAAAAIALCGVVSALPPVLRIRTIDLSRVLNADQ